MKIIGWEMGRLLVLFPPVEIIPHRGIYLPAAIESIRNEFLFTEYPDLSRSIDQLDNEGYKFKQGVLNSSGENIAISEFAIFGDGISITCRDTEQAESVWAKFFSWGKSAIGLREFSRAPSKYFRSQIVVEFEKNIENLFVNFSTISGIVGESMKYTPHKNENIGFIRFAIGADNTKIAGLNPVPFTIERRVGSPFEHNRFFCEAPLPTDKHVKALEAIETRLSSA